MEPFPALFLNVRLPLPYPIKSPCSALVPISRGKSPVSLHPGIPGPACRVKPVELAGRSQEWLSNPGMGDTRDGSRFCCHFPRFRLFQANRGIGRGLRTVPDRHVSAAGSLSVLPSFLGLLAAKPYGVPDHSFSPIGRSRGAAGLLPVAAERAEPFICRLQRAYHTD